MSRVALVHECQMCEQRRPCRWLSAPSQDIERPVTSGWYCVEDGYPIAAGLAEHGDIDRAMTDAGFEVVVSINGGRPS